MKMKMIVLLFALLFTLTACEFGQRQDSEQMLVFSTDGNLSSDSTNSWIVGIIDGSQQDSELTDMMSLTPDEMVMLFSAFDTYMNRQEGENYEMKLAYMGRFNQVYAVRFGTDDASDTETVSITVAGYIFEYAPDSGYTHILIYSDGQLYTMPDAYAAGILTEENVAAIHANWTNWTSLDRDDAQD